MHISLLYQLPIFFFVVSFPAAHRIDILREDRGTEGYQVQVQTFVHYGFDRANEYSCS